VLTVYGISNCDKIKKLINQLKETGFEFEFYNYKKNPPTEKLILKWKNYLNDWPINKRGTTYRKLKDVFELADDDKKIELIIQNSSMIKRPIVEHQSSIVSIGDLIEFEKFLKKKI